MFIPLLNIDLGTGSILFSIAIGLVSTLYFLEKTAFVKLKVLIYRDAKTAHCNEKNGIVIYSEGNQYWNVFMTKINFILSRKLF